MTDPLGTLPTLSTLATAPLIAHILDRFHEAHRRDLPVLQAQARAAVAAGAPGALAARVDTLAQALEQHMFKEEMRLFPMMEQGGNTLIGHLLDDLEAEHRQHEASIDALRAELAAWADGGETARALRRGLAALFDDLAAHVQAEDAVLFPRFADGGRRRAAL